MPINLPSNQSFVVVLKPTSNIWLLEYTSFKRLDAMTQLCFKKSGYNPDLINAFSKYKQHG